MLSNFKQIKICERIATKCIQRHFAMLSASEEFPLSISISPKKAVISPIAVQKSTLDNGIKVISYDKGNSKV